MKTANVFQKTFANEKVATFISSLDRFFIKLPHLPKKVRLFISKVLPFLILTLGVIGFAASLLSGFFLILAIIAWDSAVLLEIAGGFLLVLLDTMFLLKAFKPLRAGDATGWIYLFWAEMLEVINFVMGTINGETNVLLGTGTILLSFYVLFEIGQFYVYRKQGEAVEQLKKVV
jgi:hypothetical protein